MDPMGVFYHATLKERVPSIMARGITPRRGENITDSFSNSPNWVYFSDLETRLKSVEAIRHKLAIQTGRNWKTITTEEIIEKGAILVIDPRWGMRHIRKMPPLDARPRNAMMPGLDGGDLISGMAVPPSAILGEIDIEMLLPAPNYLPPPDKTFYGTLLSNTTRSIRLMLKQVAMTTAKTPGTHKLAGFKKGADVAFRIDFHDWSMMPGMFQNVSFIFMDQEGDEPKYHFLGDRLSWGKKLVLRNLVGPDYDTAFAQAVSDLANSGEDMGMLVAKFLHECYTVEQQNITMLTRVPLLPGRPPPEAIG